LFSEVDMRFLPFMCFPCLVSVRGLASFPADHAPVRFI
jgi:hypothetical protein